MSDVDPEMNDRPPVPRGRVAGKLSRAQRQRVQRILFGVGLLGLGALMGIFLAPESPSEANARIAALEGELANAKRQITDLQRSLKHPLVASQLPSGKLKPADRARHEREAKRYATALRRVRAQGAADLIEWFVGRWDAMLDAPTLNERAGRRAELLSLLVGGMAANLNPGDYVAWQAEFLNGNWLGDLHFDLNGDGYPGKRTMPNPHDGFANTSVCQIAMAFNQTVRDARVLMMPEMVCDRPEARMSIFLQGSTVDDALTEFVKALRHDGFVVVERVEKGTRLLLVGPGARGATPAE